MSDDFSQLSDYWRSRFSAMNRDNLNLRARVVRLNRGSFVLCFCSLVLAATLAVVIVVAAQACR